MSTRPITVEEMAQELDKAPQEAAIIVVSGSTPDGDEFEVPVKHVRVGLNKVVIEVGEV